MSSVWQQVPLHSGFTGAERAILGNCIHARSMRLHLPNSTSVLLLLIVIVNAAAYGSSSWTSANSHDVVNKRGWRKYLPFAAKRPAVPTPVSSWDTTSSSNHSPRRSPPRAETPVLSPPESPSPPRGRSPTSPLWLSPPRRQPSPSGRVSPPPGYSQLFIPHSFRSRSSSSTSSSTPPRSTWHVGESSNAPSPKRKGLWASLKDTFGGKRRKRE